MLNRLIKMNERGFSLIELMIAIALVGTLASLAVPNFLVWMQNTRIRNAAESIQNGLQVARAEAVKRNAAVQFDFRGTDSGWSVCLQPIAPGSCPIPDGVSTIQSRPAGEGSSSDIVITSTDMGPYVFNSFGGLVSPVATAADGLVRLTVDIKSSVLSASQSRDLKLLIGLGGNIRMCDPNLPATDPRKCP